MLDYEYAVDTETIIDRIKNEAENIEQMVILLKSELWAYTKFREQVALVNMYTKPILVESQQLSVVGEFWETEEDLDSAFTGYITIKSYMKNGRYITEYGKLYKQEL